MLPCGLRRATQHAEHVLSGLSVERVIFNLIVAMTTRMPSSTVKALYFHVPHVMFATKYGLVFSGVFYVLFIS